MERVDTGNPLVHRFDDVLHPIVCKRLCDILAARPNTQRVADLPWHRDDTQHWHQLPEEVVWQVHAHRMAVTALVAACFGGKVYPHFTHLVIWREGMSMQLHRDNGYHEPHLECRAYTTVTYLNDDYVGGETFVETAHGSYVSAPKLGSVVIMPSDDRAPHGVNAVTQGTRYTMPIWLTQDAFHEER